MGKTFGQLKAGDEVYIINGNSVMEENLKQLLLKDLCMRLPYGVKILHEGWNYEWDDELSTVERVVGIDDKFIYTKVINTHNGKEYRDDKHTISLFDDKIFLRPMSSMTEEERKEYYSTQSEYTHRIYPDSADFSEHTEYSWTAKTIDWLNANHFDYRGLIPKGLAIEAKEGMYN